VQKSGILFTSFVICALMTACNQSQAPLSEIVEEVSVREQPVTLKGQISPAVMDIILSAETSDRAPNQELKEQDVTAEYGNHFLFFTAIDKTGSGVEEILDHDGYANAAKYLTFWRKTVGDNVDWPDEHSTTYHGPRPAFEHGLMKNGTGWFWYRSAAQKADEYFSRAVMAWHKESAPDAPEQKEAWEWLGRSAHFIQDVTVPHHTVTLARLAQLTHNPFEDSVIKTFDQYLPSHNYDGGSWNGNGPYPEQGKWGIYYESKLPGQVVKDNADISRGLFKISKHKSDANNGNWDKVRALVVPLAAKTCAGLVVSFLQQVGVKP
jgi:hypothetical protein